MLQIVQLCSLKGQRIKIQTELGNMVTTEELFLQCITGNEPPTQPYTLPFVSETHFLLGVLYFPWPSLLPRHHPGTASILALLSAKIGGGNGLGTKTSEFRYELRLSGNKTCWNVMHMRTTAVWA